MFLPLILVTPACLVLSTSARRRLPASPPASLPGSLASPGPDINIYLHGNPGGQLTGGRRRVTWEGDTARAKKVIPLIVQQISKAIRHKPPPDKKVDMKKSVLEVIPKEDNHVKKGSLSIHLHGKPLPTDNPIGPKSHGTSRDPIGPKSHGTSRDPIGPRSHGTSRDPIGPANRNPIGTTSRHPIGSKSKGTSHDPRRLTEDFHGMTSEVRRGE
jgi:hypothetical protein